MIVGEEPKRERLRRDDAAVQAARPLELERRRVVAQAEEILVERIDVRVPHAFTKIQLACLERFWRTRIASAPMPLGVALAPKLP